MTAEERRKHIHWSIAQNPTEITIRRTRKTRSGGGFAEETITMEPMVVRLFQNRSQLPRQVSTLAGSKQIDTKYSLLADEAADIQVDSQTTDKFEAYGQKFEVVAVDPQIVNHEIVGYQVILERVK